jgi:hypothetical protein
VVYLRDSPIRSVSPCSFGANHRHKDLPSLVQPPIAPVSFNILSLFAGLVPCSLTSAQSLLVIEKASPSSKLPFQSKFTSINCSMCNQSRDPYFLPCPRAPLAVFRSLCPTNRTPAYGATFIPSRLRALPTPGPFDGFTFGLTCHRN